MMCASVLQNEELLDRSKKLKRSNEFWIMFDLCFVVADILLATFIINIIILKVIFYVTAFLFLILSFNHYNIRKRAIQYIEALKKIEETKGELVNGDQNPI